MDIEQTIPDAGYLEWYGLNRLSESYRHEGIECEALPAGPS